MEPFLAYRIHRDEEKKVGGRLERISLDDLNEGDVVIRAAWSGINYKGRAGRDRRRQDRAPLPDGGRNRRGRHRARLRR